MEGRRPKSPDRRSVRPMPLCMHSSPWAWLPAELGRSRFERSSLWIGGALVEVICGAAGGNRPVDAVAVESRRRDGGRVLPPLVTVHRCFRQPDCLSLVSGGGNSRPRRLFFFAMPSLPLSRTELPGR